MATPRRSVRDNPARPLTPLASSRDADGLSSGATSDVEPAPVADAQATANLVSALRVLNLAGERFRQAVALHFSVGLSETFAMSHLAASGPVSPRQLADLVGLTPSTVTALLDRLEQAGLAVRTPHSTDRRKTVVSVSPRGRELLGLVQSWMQDATRVIEPAQLPNATAMLLQLAQGLQNKAGEISEGAA